VEVQTVSHGMRVPRASSSLALARRFKPTARFLRM